MYETFSPGAGMSCRLSSTLWPSPPDLTNAEASAHRAQTGPVSSTAISPPHLGHQRVTRFSSLISTENGKFRQRLQPFHRLGRLTKYRTSSSQSSLFVTVC